MQYSTPHAYYKDIYTYLVHVDPGQIQTHLYVRGEFGQLQAQKKRAVGAPSSCLPTSCQCEDVIPAHKRCISRDAIEIDIPQLVDDIW
jgi:hypothetical protein